jgi:class III lanthionine synthetase
MVLDGIGASTELFCICDREHFEDLSSYRPACDDFAGLIRQIWPAEWALHQRSMWYEGTPPEGVARGQGFKVHVSAPVELGRSVLSAVLPVIVNNSCAFKVVVNRFIHRLINSKNFPRASACKFVTIYPPSDAVCQRVLDELHLSTRSYSGPYILSDKAYKDSTCVYYRYGAFQRQARLTVCGESRLTMVDPSGASIDDVRRPIFTLPPGVDDPFDPCPLNGKISTTLQGRYTITGALRFSNKGGIYKARTIIGDRRVLIKESRPHIVIGSFVERDAITALRAEHRALELLSPSGFAPQPIDYFVLEGHHFLVMEELAAIPITKFRSFERISVLLGRTHDRAQVDRFVDVFRMVAEQLIAAVEVCHHAGFVLGDLAAQNVLIDEKTYRIWLVDFESIRFDTADDRSALPFTFGFTTAERIVDGIPTALDDFYGIGAILFSMVLPVQPLSRFISNCTREFIDLIDSEIAVPSAVWAVIEAFLSGDVDEARSRLADLAPERRTYPPIAPKEGGAPLDAGECIGKIADYILATRDVGRTDRLWPSDYRVFQTNPLGLGYGAVGVAVFLSRAGREVPFACVDFLKEGVRRLELPPGIYVGSAGLARGLFELGHEDLAIDQMRRAIASPLLYDCSDIFYGCAGVGMMSLQFWNLTNEERFLIAADKIGTFLLANREQEGSACTWRNVDGRTYIGWAHGAAGIAAFLLALYQETGTERYLTCAVAALESDLAEGVEVEGSLGWSHLKGNHTVFPYWRYGSAGIGLAALRFWKALHEDRYLQIAEKAARYIAPKYALQSGQFNGIAGLGEFLLDMYDATAQPEYHRQAAQIARRMMPYRIVRPSGIAFPGEGLVAICNDFGTGSAGVGIFLLRLLRRHIRTGSDWLRFPDQTASERTAAPCPM